MLRPLTIALAVVGYTWMVLVRAAGYPPVAYVGLAPALAALWVVLRATRPAEPADLARARVATRVAATGALLSTMGLVAFHTAEGRLAVAAGGALASLWGLVALGRVRAEPGVVARLATTSEQPASKLLATLGWAYALTACGVEVFSPEDLARVPGGDAGLALSVAALGSAGATLATGGLELARRRLELGAVERLRAFALLAGAFVAIAVIAGALRLAPLPQLFALTALATSLTACAVSVTSSPETVGRLATQLAALGVTAVAPAVVLAALAKHQPEHAAAAVFGAAALAALGGAAAPALARLLLPRTEPWSAAFEAASQAALHPDPEPALERALLALRGLSTRKLEAPCLFRFDPPAVTSVDLAGYARTEPASIPEGFAEVARGETENVVSRESLEVAAVRRAEVRPLLAWLDDRRLRAVAVVFDEELATGMLGLPRGERTSPLSLAEVRALGHLSSLLGAQLSAAAKLARAREREGASREKEEAASRSRDAVLGDLASERRRGEAVCRILAARALVARYSPAARLALSTLEGLGADGRALSLIVPAGIDPLPYLCVYHLASERKSSALYVVDGKSPELTDLELWRSEDRSPLAEARGGTLAIVDPQLLPRLVQAYVAAAHRQSADRPREERAALALVVPRTPDALVARGTLEESLADALGDRAVLVPPLAARTEDLRAMALDRLTKLGLDRSGRPYGIEPAAMSLLVEHDWPGNDVELDSLLVRVAAELEGDVVSKRDLVRAGLGQGERDVKKRAS